MRTLLVWIARLAGIVGVIAIVLAVLARVVGLYWLGSFQVGTVLQAGMAATLIACLGYLVAFVEGSGK